MVEPGRQGRRGRQPQDARPQARFPFEGRLPVEDDGAVVGADRHDEPVARRPRAVRANGRRTTTSHRGRVAGIDGGAERARLDLAGAFEGPLHGLADHWRGKNGIGGRQDPAPAGSVAAQPVDLEERAGPRHTGRVDDLDEGSHDRVPRPGGALLLGKLGARRQPKRQGPRPPGRIAESRPPPRARHHDASGGEPPDRRSRRGPPGR